MMTESLISCDFIYTYNVCLLIPPPLTSPPPQSPAPHNALTITMAYAQPLSAAPNTNSHQPASAARYHCITA